jgi:hypothetical protein
MAHNQTTERNPRVTWFTILSILTGDLLPMSNLLPAGLQRGWGAIHIELR